VRIGRLESLSVNAKNFRGAFDGDVLLELNRGQRRQRRTARPVYYFTAMLGGANFGGETLL